jgi:hypothetical protein
MTLDPLVVSSAVAAPHGRCRGNERVAGGSRMAIAPCVDRSRSLMLR